VFKTDIIDKKVVMPVAMFQQSPLQFVRPKGWYFDIAVEKKEDNTFNALLLQCTHQENQLTPDGNTGFHCSLHGSRFDKNGYVLKGPAEKPLERYKTYVESDNLIIQIPKAPIY
jgi:Rieske Fe-S protein